jgi:hypothetical protein
MKANKFKIMKQFFLACFVLISVLCSAQLDRLSAGMPLQEVKAIFTGMYRDDGSMTSWASGETRLWGTEGRGTYAICADTVISYQFQSVSASGPSDLFPKADSVAVEKLLTSAKTLIGHYTDMLGNPIEKRSQSLVFPPDNRPDVDVLLARWKGTENDLMIRVYRSNPTMANTINSASARENSTSENYYFEVFASGKGLRLRTEFGIGMTADQFKIWQPELANQVQKFPDCWAADQTDGTLKAHWRFQFKEGKLIGFFYDVQSGFDYGTATEIAYLAVLKQAQNFKAEAEKKYGKPYLDSTAVSEKYKSPKKNNMYYSRVDYLAQWKPDTDFLMIRMNERGGGKQGSPVFHLEVFFGKRD